LFENGAKMKSTKPQSFLEKSIILLWVIINLSLFLISTGKVSHIHQFLFEGVSPFLRSFSRINFYNYFIDFMTSFFGVLLFSLSCTAFGAFVLDLFGGWLIKSIKSKLSLFAYFGTAFLVGEIIISSIFLLLCSIYKLSTGDVILAMAVMAIIGIPSFIRLLSPNPLKQVSIETVRSTTKFDGFLFWVSIAILLLTLLYSSARLSYDAVGMYFSDAKIIAMTDRIQFFSDIYVVGSLHTGIQYAAIIQVFGDQAARMYSWIGGLIIIFFSLAIGEKVGISQRALLFLQIMILTSTVFIDLMGDGKIDLQTSAPIFAAIYWMLVKKRSKTERWVYFLIGILIGFSIISRLFNAFLLFIFVGLYYFWQMYSQRKNGKWDISLFLEPAFGIGAGVFLLIGFHLIANQIIMGDALTPLKTLSRVNSSVWHYSYDPKDIWIYRLLYPFVVTYINSPQSLGNISPVFVAFIPSLFLVGIRKSVKLSEDVIVLSIIATITLILWIALVYMVVEIRYVLFLWVILFLPASIIMDKVLQIEDRVFSCILNLYLAALLLFIMVRVFFISISTYSPIDDSHSPQCYDSLLCEFIRPINQVASDGERVLALNAYRYYMRPDLFACSSKADEYILLQKASLDGANEFWEEVFREGYQYVVYEENFAKIHMLINLTLNPEETPSWLTLEPISGISGEDHVVYRLIAENPPFVPEKICKEISPGLWLVE
jgi:hypothetical protein